MSNKILRNVLAVILLVSVNGRTDAVQVGSRLQIYMPREITVEGNVPVLSQMAVLRGNESLIAKANQIAMGRISVLGQKIVIDRTMLLGRLACNGIDVSEVEITGAEKTTVTQRYQVVRGEELVQKAIDFLKKTQTDMSIGGWNAVRTPENLSIPGSGENLKISANIVEGGINNLTRVKVAVFSNDKAIGEREISFRAKYLCRKAVAKIDIPQGGIIRAENIKMEEIMSDRPESVSDGAFYGCVAKQRIAAGTVITANMAVAVKPKILISRNDNVVIKISRLGFLVTANGKALQDGRVGEYIKVQNMDSQRVIMAKVNDDGEVEPVF